MHADEIEIDEALVRRLVAAQFPQWAERSVERVASAGTDNALYRLGTDMVVRLPRRKDACSALLRERRWLPRLAPHLPIQVPLPLGEGVPDDGYPCQWSVYSWLQGEDATTARVEDLGRFAVDLAGFLVSLQQLEPDGPPPGEENYGRGQPLAARDAPARRAIAALRGEIDDGAVTAVWEMALRAPEWERPPVWIHGDLDARNLLIADGRLSAAVDWGCLAVGDPASDLMVAWKMLPANARAGFRAALPFDDGTWVRARGWVLSQAVIALAYYTLETNPVLVYAARRWLSEVLADAATKA